METMELLNKYAKRAWKSHLFFIRETPKYLGKMTFRRILYYPIAYIKFMYYSRITWTAKYLRE